MCMCACAYVRVHACMMCMCVHVCVSTELTCTDLRWSKRAANRRSIMASQASNSMPRIQSAGLQDSEGTQAHM